MSNWNINLRADGNWDIIPQDGDAARSFTINTQTLEAHGYWWCSDDEFKQIIQEIKQRSTSNVTPVDNTQTITEGN